MRIVDSTNPGNTTPAKTGRTGELHSTDAAGKTGSPTRKDSVGSDSVELSGFTDRLSRTMQGAAVSRAQRVTELTAAVRSGSYLADAKAVSHSLVSEAISSGGNGKL